MKLEQNPRGGCYDLNLREARNWAGEVKKTLLVVQS